MTRLLVAYDGSAAARRALDHAAGLARTGDELVVVSVMPEPGVSAHIGPPPALRRRQREQLEEAGAMLAAYGLAARVDDPVGDAAAEIVAAGERLEADVIVVGRRRHHRGPRVHPTTSARVVRAATCDVLVVPEEGGAEPDAPA